MGLPPDYPILIGFSIIFTIHFGGFPHYFWISTPGLITRRFGSNSQLPPKSDVYGIRRIRISEQPVPFCWKFYSPKTAGNLKNTPSTKKNPGVKKPPIFEIYYHHFFWVSLHPRRQKVVHQSRPIVRWLGANVPIWASHPDCFFQTGVGKWLQEWLVDTVVLIYVNKHNLKIYMNILRMMNM